MHPGKKGGSKFLSLTSAIIIALTFAGWPERAGADEIVEYQKALNAYNSGEYELAIERFKALLEKKTPTTDRALLIEIHKYLGASYLFNGQRQEGRKQFELLLLIQPDYQLDPVLFPTEILDEFWAVKEKLKQELKKIEEKKKKQEEKLRQKREKIIKTWKLLVKDSTNRAYVKKTVKKNNILLAFLPLGVGQFQNEQKIKGYLFLSGELLLFAANVTTYAIASRYRNLWERADNASSKEKIANIGKNFVIVQHISFWALLSVTLAGIIDALIFYKPQKVTYEKVDEREIPPVYRKKPLKIPDIDIEEVLGLKIRW